jgi:calmodulin/calcium-binding protein CML
MEEKLNFIREIFNIFDKESEGWISVKDLPSICSYLFVNCPSEAEIMNMFGIAGFDNELKITFEEFYLSIYKHEVGIRQENIEEAFRKFDKKGTGKITKAELRSIVESENIGLSGEDVNEIVEQYGLNGIEEIEYGKLIDEFFLEKSDC